MNAFHQTILPLFNQPRAEWLEDARVKAYVIAVERGLKGQLPRLTTDDIHNACPIPDGIDPRVMGAVFASKDWLKVGYTQSKRKVCHNRPIAIFQLI